MEISHYPGGACEPVTILDRDFDAIGIEHTLADFAGWQAMPQDQRDALRQRADSFLGA